MKVKHILLTSILLTGLAASGQTIENESKEVVDVVSADSLVIDTTIVVDPLPAFLFSPQVYVTYKSDDSIRIKPASQGRPEYDMMQWIERENRLNKFVAAARQRHQLSHPGDVRYNIKDLPKAPEAVIITVDDPAKVDISVADVAGDIAPAIGQVEVQRQYWINKLGINFQFSQAYISPNWYQGGTSSLNLIADFTYSSNLNTKFHPNLLFENFFQWRTALTSTPDDEYRNYSITENRLQINSKFGYRASKKWYYTITGVFKTPIFTSYKRNSTEVSGSFLSPGELNFGLGMTFNTENKSKSMSFNATIAPLSYNLKTVIDGRVNEVSQGLKEGRKTKNSIGSNIDAVLNWKICYNVNWRSRIFFFTNYEYSQMDWQNQFQFTINRYLTANLNVDMRYDTSVKGDKRNTSWKLLQLRELISLGFTYNINH